MVKIERIMMEPDFAHRDLLSLAPLLLKVNEPN